MTETLVLRRAAELSLHEEELTLGRVAALSRRGPGKDDDNEDAILVHALGDRALLLAVADGCGGLPAGAEAAEAALAALLATLSRHSEEGTEPANLVLEGFDAANKAVLGLGLGAGTTLAVALVEPGKVRCYHAGDTRILICGQRGKRKLLTVDHSPSAFLHEAGALSEVEAIGHEDRNLIFNLVGSPEMRVEVGSSRRLAAMDTVVIATDGLGDNLLVEEIVELARKGPLDRAARELCALARERMASGGPGIPGHPDDLSVVLYRAGRAALRTAPPS
ncbi:MAG: protein phosphatase 2C domain-containing protein [Planctomycetota bacterium]